MFSSILPGTENLFKYLLTIGFILLFFSLVYPLQKEQQLKIDELNLLMKVEKLHFEIEVLDKKVAQLQHAKSRSLQELNEATKTAYDLKIKNIEAGYEIKKHEELKCQILSYKIYKFGFLGFGIFLIILGFRFWLSSTFIDESEKCKNLNPPYTSSFLRLRVFIKKILFMR